jgi:hypothetical protein
MPACRPYLDDLLDRRVAVCERSDSWTRLGKHGKCAAEQERE